jgi:hypothetical protein
MDSMKNPTVEYQSQLQNIPSDFMFNKIPDVPYIYPVLHICRVENGMLCITLPTLSEPLISTLPCAFMPSTPLFFCTALRQKCLFVLAQGSQLSRLSLEKEFLEFENIVVGDKGTPGKFECMSQLLMPLPHPNTESSEFKKHVRFVWEFINIFFF